MNFNMYMQYRWECGRPIKRQRQPKQLHRMHQAKPALEFSACLQESTRLTLDVLSSGKAVGRPGRQVGLS